MSISYQGSIIVEFLPQRVAGRRGLGFYRLIFLFRYEIIARQSGQEYEFKNPRAEVKVGLSEKDARLLGMAESDGPLFVKTKNFFQTSTMAFHLDLDQQRLNAIEGIRRGGDLLFMFRIFGEVYENGNPWTAQDELRIPVNQTEWINVLRQMSYSDFLLFEVPLPAEDAPQELKDAIGFLSNANHHFLAGNYDATIAICRSALESLTRGLKEDKELAEAIGLYGDKQKRKTMSKEQRCLFIREAMKRYTHLAHHPADAGESVCYTRDDAALTLSVTASLISHTRQKVFCYSERDEKQEVE